MPETPLMTFVLGLLTPFLMTSGITDPALARLAAREAVAAHETACPGQTLTVGSIVAFALAALDDLRLSMAPGLSPTLTLRLRGNANALDRSAQNNTKLLKTRDDPATPAPRPDVPEAPQAAAATTEAENRMEWANGMTRAANALRANAKNVSAEQRATDGLWIQALTGAAGDLRRAKPPRPGSRSALLCSTILASGSGFPASPGARA